MPNQSTSSPPDPPYLIRTGELQPDALHLRPHVLNPAVQRLQLSLGDSVGLTKTGIHLIRLVGNGMESTTLHYHTHDDEWFYILDAPEGATICVKEGSAEAKEQQVRRGDFFAFPAGHELAHRFKNESERDLVYLCGGSREAIDICIYPEMGQRLVSNRVEDTRWTVADADTISARRSAPTPASPLSTPYFMTTSGPEFDRHTGFHKHRLDPANAEVGKNRMGERAGLTRTSIHFQRVRPQQTSTVLHWHGVDDEWFYVLEAGDDAVVCVQEGAGHEVKEHKVRPGDFAGFPAGKPWGHAFKSGNAELVYLCGGTSTSVDECHYPLLGKRVLIDRGVGKASWVVSEDKVHGQKVQKYATRE